MEIEIFKEDFIIQEKPFHCLVEMEFYFEDSIEEYYDNENVVSKYALNMLSIAYPYIRAYISTLSAISGIEQIHLPAINVYDTFKNNYNKKSLLLTVRGRDFLFIRYILHVYSLAFLIF